MELELAIRLAAFTWLSEKCQALGDVLPRDLLAQGFYYEDKRIPLLSPQGIFKPQYLHLPLSITTAPKGPYEDHFTGQLLNYRYRGTDPNHRDNAGLRTAMQTKTPLVYFYGIAPGQYVPAWPVFIVGDDPASLTFKVAIDDIAHFDFESGIVLNVEEQEIRRAYRASIVRTRLHQSAFRERVLQAYRTTCAFCRLRHRELLDAAHIVPDSDPEGRPSITNGISLCKLHHAAFDSFMIAVTPDYVIKVRNDILEESDGPILLHGLQGLHNSRLFLPRLETQWPDKELLDRRWQQFRDAV